MAICELCGKIFSTSQGLRGHKTFVHGIRADGGKMLALAGRLRGTDNPEGKLEAGNLRLNENRVKLVNLEIRLTEMEHIIVKLEKTSKKLGNDIALLATRSEVHDLASNVKRIREQVEKHDRWLNPRGLHDAVVGLNGGPIANIERKLESGRAKVAH